MPTVTPFITLTANLQSIIGDAELSGAALMITLCGYGQIIPVVPGQGVLADAGVPQIITQSGSTSISVELFSNFQITPAGTYYEIAVIDENENVIQSGVYQFTATSAQTIDLSNAVPITGPLGLLVTEAVMGTYPGESFTTTYNALNGALLGLYYRGVLLRPGVDYTLNGTAIALTFAAKKDFEGEPTLWAVYVTSGTASLPFPMVSIPTGAMPGSVYTLPIGALSNQLLGLFYDGVFQRPGVDYTLSGTTLTLNFNTRAGASLYAVYLPS
jgi:hypothetical protein